MRLFWIFLGLAVLFLIPFLIWGGALEAMFSQESTIEWLRGYGAWAWVAGIVLLMSDIVLPVPGTVVMSAMGFVYGPIAGGLFAALGSFLGGSLGYGLCRLLGRGAALRILGEKDLEKGERMFSTIGGWLVALSRWLPLFPEVIACMAGLIRMPAGLFHFALACGVLPLGFAFAYIGHAGVAHPWLAIVLSACIPPVLWLAVRPIVRRMIGGDAPPHS